MHDLNPAMQFCDKVVLLSGGGVLAAGAIEEYLDPEDKKPPTAWAPSSNTSMAGHIMVQRTHLRSFIL